MMKLFYSPGACSLASHIALCESGQKFATEKVALNTHQYSGGDYYSVNKKGSVPALEIAPGQVLTEGAAVLQYIGDQAPGSGLSPAAGTVDRYRLQEWLNYIATEMHKTVSPLFSQTTPEEYKVVVKKNLAKKLDFLAEHFKTNAYLLGSHYSVADAYLFTILAWLPKFKIDLSGWPTVDAFFNRVKARPATQTALRDEGMTL